MCHSLAIFAFLVEPNQKFLLHFCDFHFGKPKTLRDDVLRGRRLVRTLGPRGYLCGVHPDENKTKKRENARERTILAGGRVRPSGPTRGHLGVPMQIKWAGRPGQPLRGVLSVNQVVSVGPT
jgi:hypothetical protein